MSACLIEKHDLGMIPYLEALQQQLVFSQKAQRVERGKTADKTDRMDKCYLLLAEHPPVVTLGKRANPADVISSNANVAVYALERGGGATVHMPGQLVCYPITRLPALRVRVFVRMLEDTLLQLLDDYGIAARVYEDKPGVWVDRAKIAAVGIRVKGRVTRHGLALNVNNSLELYERIVPCRMPDMASTSMFELLGRELDMQELKSRFVKFFTHNFALV